MVIEEEVEVEDGAAREEAAEAKDAITVFEGQSWMARPAAAAMGVSLSRS